MRRRAWWLLVPLVLAGPACSDSEPAEATAPAPKSDVPPPAPAPASDADSELTIEDGLPTEPVVRLLEPGSRTPQTLPARTPGTERRVVVELKITEGKKKTLHLPITRIAADVVLEGIDDGGSRYRWTPRGLQVQASEGVDPEFLASYEKTLAPGNPPTPVALATDRWDVTTTMAWPPQGNPHAATAGVAQRLALSHLAIPVPQLELGEGATWQVNRRIDLFGAPAWQTLECKAKKIAGHQLEVEASIDYRMIDGESATTGVLGIANVVALSGVGKLRARYDMATALPVDVQVRGKLQITPGPGAKPKRFGFELRADEDYLATADPRVTFRGAFTQGGLVRGAVAPGTKVWLNKQRVKVSEDGHFMLGFGRDAPPRALVAYSFDGAPNERHVVHVEDRTFEPEAIDGLPPEMVDLDAETRKALVKSRTRVKKARSKSSDLTGFREDFRWPARGKITSTYGRKRILNGEDRGYHWGVDLAAREGTKVRAPAGGVVVFAESDVPLSGNLLIIDHGHGLTSSFLHLQKFKAKVGDEVKAGQVVATLGNTGRSTGPHLDWRMNLFDTRIDPQTLVPPKP